MRITRKRPATTGPKPLSLALQGGGSHGAFQWGVLDRLLEDDRVTISAVTAASAGAVNAVGLAAGLIEGGPAGARSKLDALWRAISDAGGRNMFGESGLWSAGGDWLKATPAFRYLETLAMSATPYELNPLNLNPMRDVLREQIDFKVIRERSPIEIYVCATMVRTTEAKVFNATDLTLNHILASACLPYLFQAVEIDGEAYWDGGYLANPPIFPLVRSKASRDVLIVMLNPLNRAKTPRSAGDIMDRLNEITFNAPLAAELRTIAMVHSLIEDGSMKPKTGYDRLRFHAVGVADELSDLKLSSKFNTDWLFLQDLKARGRKSAQAWLETALPQVGVSSTFDLGKTFL